jgi:hypothetical protein
MHDSFAKTKELRGVTEAIFREEIVPANRPVIMRGLIDSWPVVIQGKSSPLDACKYLLQFYRGAKVPLLIGDTPGKRHIFYEDGMAGLNFERYPVVLPEALQVLLDQLDDGKAPAIFMESLPLPKYLPQFTDANTIPLLSSDIAPNIWIGNAVKVQTHFDLKQNVACVAAGRRRFTLFPPAQLPNLYIGPLDFTPAGTPVSMVSLDNPDFERYPRFREALESAEVAELAAGDALYIPYAWWHQVQSLDSFNILVNYWWNDVASPASPYDALLNAVMAFRELPPNERKVWQGMFEYFAFETNGRALDHLAPEHRGLMGPTSEQKTAEIKSVLARAFN